MRVRIVKWETELIMIEKNRFRFFRVLDNLASVDKRPDHIENTRVTNELLDQKSK